ncbi:MAG: class I SAM-dependent methyltransferase [Deltaproteobacteria bacterium]|nr:class I SAM-dependent methyltransferase [Deltaproteobacteria bacterium]MBW1960272.1 class I SAM-dependent methyltransferase [Deltaproteobacteria bacterium]MBW1993625.1 class I SAM-dependent methyltransferase [Deltaproteobacteria bacterium]MBW2150315.1 class I SAM-dependent methyltransferase [Deltaproteobacteria bacterium]
MGNHLCPTWIGYLLLSPFRKLLENPYKMLGRFVSPGMTVLEPGCAMGFFTLPLAKMVGSNGRVIAVEIQDKMLEVLRRRAKKAGVLDRIELRLANEQSLGVDDLREKVDFAAALHVVHEVSEQACFLKEIWNSLKPGGMLLVIEPKHHVSRKNFARSLAWADKIGFRKQNLSGKFGDRSALLLRPDR